MMVEAREGSDEDGHRIEEVENEFLEDYENWKDNCLAKFSKFLGFPTKGFKNEILKLMRKLVAMQQLVKKMGTTTVSKCEWELRKLESSINYNEKDKNKGGGSDKGN